MSLWDDFDCEMHPVALDTDTVDRLLAGAIAPADAPPGYSDVARLLRAVSAEAMPEELAGETETVGIVATVVRLSLDARSVASRRSFIPFALSRPRRMTLALVAAALACTATAASAGALPGAAQDVASSMLAKVGISVPGANENAGTHPDERGTSSPRTPKPESTAGKGAEISELATTTDLTGVDKGAAISAAASNGKSHAGQDSSASGGGAASVERPGGGGTGTAGAASGGKSSSGTSKADSASNGHSSAGSGNASRRPKTAGR